MTTITVAAAMAKGGADFENNVFCHFNWFRVFRFGAREDHLKTLNLKQKQSEEHFLESA